MANEKKSRAVDFFERQIEAPDNEHYMGVRGVTVRIESELVFMADVLAKKAGVSRSVFLAEMIEFGIRDILERTEAQGDEYLTFSNLSAIHLNGLEGA